MERALEGKEMKEGTGEGDAGREGKNACGERKDEGRKKGRP